jgi:hypothetical protein
LKQVAKKQAERLAHSQIKMIEVHAEVRQLRIKVRSHVGFGRPEVDVLEVGLVGLQLDMDSRKWDTSVTGDLQGMYLASLLGSAPEYVLTCAAELDPDKDGVLDGDVSVAQLVRSMEQAATSFIRVSVAICNELSPVLLTEFGAVLTKGSIECKVVHLVLCQQTVIALIQRANHMADQIAAGAAAAAAAATAASTAARLATEPSGANGGGVGVDMGGTASARWPTERPSATTTATAAAADDVPKSGADSGAGVFMIGATEVVPMVLGVKFEALRVRLTAKQQPLMTAEVSRMAANIQMTDARPVHLHATLGSLTVLDDSEAGSSYTALVAPAAAGVSADDWLVVLSFETYLLHQQHPGTGNGEGFGSSVEVRCEPLVMTYLNRFTAELSGYVGPITVAAATHNEHLTTLCVAVRLLACVYIPLGCLRVYAFLPAVCVCTHSFRLFACVHFLRLLAFEYIPSGYWRVYGCWRVYTFLSAVACVNSFRLWRVYTVLASVLGAWADAVRAGAGRFRFGLNARVVSGNRCRFGG